MRMMPRWDGPGRVDREKLEISLDSRLSSQTYHLCSFH